MEQDQTRQWTELAQSRELTGRIQAMTELSEEQLDQAAGGRGKDVGFPDPPKVDGQPSSEPPMAR